jgi:ABC-type glycerol-3-phosphate transport system permease component
MPILSAIGRRSPGQVAIRVGIYALLTLGAGAIVYPVLIVLGQAMSNAYDLRDNAVIPYYLRDRNELALKRIFSFTTKVDLLAGRHNRNKWSSQTQMRDDATFYDDVPKLLARQGLSLEAWETIVADLDEFKLKHMSSDELLAKEFRVEDYFRPFLRDRHGGLADAFLTERRKTGRLPRWFVRTYPDADERERIVCDRDRLGLAIMNHEWKSDYLNYYSVEVPRPGNFTVPFWRPGSSPQEKMWSDFKTSLPPQQKLIISSDSYWHTYLKLKYRTIAELNAAWGTKHGGFYELRVPLAPPASPTVRKDWEEFIIKRWPRRLLKIPSKYADAWRQYVRSQLLRKVGARADAEAAALAEASRLVGRPVASWDKLPFWGDLPQDETLSRYWGELTSCGAVGPADMELCAPELRFRRFLGLKYGGSGPARPDAETLAKLNAAWKTDFKSFDEIPLPLMLADYAPVRFHPWHIRRSFMTESFRRVAEYLFGRGRAVQNTLILVVCALASVLTINPIAAYSLSRFPMKHTQKVLIFFLATMAFPAEVAMIPNFLLLRDLGLLNTFAALVLPGMANGFAIFLLKGFFDSLPQELYEAAEIDGASELRIFRVVAVPLVKPILAFIGLNTFVFAYSSFMWAFVICPRPRMWTLMVWVYDFQMKNPGNNYILAATVLVSIPPLIVFFFANRIIMKGIVIPSMK